MQKNGIKNARKGSSIVENLNEIKEIWTMILGELQQRLNLSNTAMTLWFGDISITSFSDNILSIKTSTDYKKEIIESRYIAHIEDLFEVFMGFRIAVAVLVDKKTNSLNLDDLKKRISGESRSHEIDNLTRIIPTSRESTVR